MMVAVMLIIMRLMILKVFEDEDEEHNTGFFLTDAFLQGLGTYCHVIQQESTHLYSF